MTPTTMTRPSVAAQGLTRKRIEEGPILLATKPFDGTDAPLAVARWLARREERELDVVSVLEQNDALAVSAGAPPLPMRYYEEEVASITARMRAALDAHSDGALTSRVAVLDGPAAPMITERAREVDARVIVVGTGRHDAFGRIVYGERALQIVRLADRPVLVVPRDTRAGSFMNAIVSVDFGPASLRAARALLPMLSEGSRVTLVHVRPDLPEPPDRHGYEVRCDDLFDRFRMQLRVLPGFTVETRVLWGDAATVIQAYAQHNHVDLIACGRRRTHSLVERFMLGSVSSALLRTVSCPLLIAPEQPEAVTEQLSKVLTGVQTWRRDRWAEQLRAISLSCAGRPVRLGVEADVLHGGRSISQDYVLRSVSFDPDVGANELSILLADASRPSNLLNVKFTDVTGLTAFTDASGALTRLVCDRDAGLVTMTMTTD
ncbi:MAG: universal stress protein [Gemmatimonadaceae bacterium]